MIVLGISMWLILANPFIGALQAAVGGGLRPVRNRIGSEP